MERLAENIVAWHNRHPLARRIRVQDVHTVGVVALPFMRSTQGPAKGGGQEPVLTDMVEGGATPPDAADGPPGGSALDRAISASLRRAPPPGSTLKGLDGLSRLLALVPGKAPPLAWAAFDEAFLPGVRPKRVERFALAHGYPEPPASRDAMPWRVVPVKTMPGEGWPFELYTLSAGIDAGPARTRVLAGRGYPAEIIGHRAYSPIRLALAALLALGLAGGLGTVAWPWLKPMLGTVPAAPAASAPAAVPASAPASAPKPVRMAASAVSAVPAASSAASAASAPAVPASRAAPAAKASAPAASAPALPQEAASEGPPPDIRPHLVQLVPMREGKDGKPRPPLRVSEPGASAPAAQPAVANASAREAPKARAAATSGKAASSASSQDARLNQLAQAPARSVVALVGPPGSKAEAEALLKKMQAALGTVHNDPASLQAQVLETPEGWRATVWPFTSREQAALINAVLVAHGMRTRAIDF